MQDKTPIYMMIIVGMVALVGLIVMLTAPQATTADTGMTGNVVFSNSAGVFTIFGKLFFTLALIGIAGYMYFKKN